MRIPSFYCHFCLYPLVWRVSEEASYDHVWLYLIEFDHQVAEGVDKDTEDEEEPQHLKNLSSCRSPKWRNPPGPSLKLIRGTPQKSRRIPASRSSWCLYKLLGSSGCLLWCWKVGTEVKCAAMWKKTWALVWYWRPLIHPIVYIFRSSSTMLSPYFSQISCLKLLSIAFL